MVDVVWPQGILLDFYGTVVEEDDPVISSICRAVFEKATTGHPSGAGAVGKYWSGVFADACMAAAGPTFVSQRILEHRSLQETASHFGADLDLDSLSKQIFAYWQRPPLLPDAVDFLAMDRPVCIVSNIDRQDLDAAMADHGIRVDLSVTSEDVRAYKPRPEPFQLALDLLGLNHDDVLHVGDSLSTDVTGANALGIPVAWVNRTGRRRPPTSRIAHEVPDLAALARALE
jgi:2-haloalkanoic acid dehalogenase type II